MAKKMTEQPKAVIRRTFSESFKRQRVEEYNNRLVRVSEISKVYRVTNTAVYKWIKKYSAGFNPGVRVVIELESEAKRTLELSRQKEELEKVIGQKQLIVDFLETVIQRASKEFKIDLKKTFSGKQ